MNATLAWRLAADAVLLLHFAYVLFVVLGLALILAGGLLQWRWVRNPVFRTLHLLAIAVVVAQAWLGMVCPLTTLENVLRARAYDATYPGDFISWWVHRVLFWQAPPVVFSVIYTVFGLLVAASWLWVRPAASGQNGAGKPSPKNARAEPSSTSPVRSQS